MKKSILSSVALLITAAVALSGCTQQSGKSPESDEQKNSAPESVFDTAAPTESTTAPETQAQSTAAMPQVAPETKTETKTETEKTSNDGEPMSEKENSVNTTEDAEKNVGSTTIDDSLLKETISSETEIPIEIIPDATSNPPLKTPLKAFTAQCFISSLQEKDGKYYGSCEFIIKNETDTASKGWTVSITVPKGFELVFSQNGVFNLNGTSLVVTNEKDNGVIKKGENLSFCFDFVSPEKVDNFPSIVTDSGAPTIDLHRVEQAEA